LPVAEKNNIAVSLFCDACNIVSFVFCIIKAFINHLQMQQQGQNAFAPLFRTLIDDLLPLYRHLPYAHGY